LGAAALELATRGPPILVDPARVLAIGVTEVNTRAVLPRGERQLAEMARDNPKSEVGSADASPANEVFGGDEDASVRAGATACAARQAVELVAGVHACKIAPLADGALRRSLGYAAISEARSMSDASVTIQPVGPVSVASRVWRYRGHFHVTAIAKATFAFAHGERMRVERPIPLHSAEIPSGVARGVVHAPYDMVPLLPRADVTFVGHAYTHAPGGARSARVRLALSRPREPESKGSDGPLLLDKTLEIHGNRSVTTGWGTSQAALFTKLPITYDRALGGSGHALNPVGTGIDRDARGRVQLPNVTNPPHTPMAVEPAGFGPLSMGWPSRTRMLPDLAAALASPVIDLPEDVDLGLFHSAPFDQRIEFLRGDEWLILDKVHPKYERLETQLPFVCGVARVHVRSGEVHALQMRADALFIDGDAEMATLVFRGSFPVPSFDALRMIAISAGMEQRGQAVVWPEVDWPSSLVLEVGASSPLRDTVQPSTEPRRDPAIGRTMPSVPHDEPQPSSGVVVIEMAAERPPETVLLSSTRLKGGTLVLEPEQFALEETRDAQRPLVIDMSGVVPLSAWRDDDTSDLESTHQLDVADARAHAASTKRGGD
jgi:hypothetical protein